LMSALLVNTARWADLPFSFATSGGKRAPLPPALSSSLPC
jgi:hypothetical protein